MKQWIDDYIWFIKTSMEFCKGRYPKYLIFVIAVFKGFGFCQLMKQTTKSKFEEYNIDDIPLISNEKRRRKKW